MGESSIRRHKLTGAAAVLRRGDSDSTAARTCRATGEALLARRERRRSKVLRITGDTRKSGEGERVAEGPAVARKRSNVCGAKGPRCMRWLHQKREARMHEKNIH